MKFNFTLLSFNVLSETYLVRHQQELYSSYPPRVLQWQHRRDLIIKEILSTNPDIVCLQEVDNSYFYEFYSPALSGFGFAGHFLPRTKYRIADGVAIFYRKVLFKLLDCRSVDMDKGAGVLKSSNVALIALLEPIIPKHPWEKTG